MSRPNAPLTIPDVRPLVDALYQRQSAGCCLHIVLDDGNVGDASVRFCVETAQMARHRECYALALLLLTMSQTQRRKLAR